MARNTDTDDRPGAGERDGLLDRLGVTDLLPEWIDEAAPSPAQAPRLKTQDSP